MTGSLVCCSTKGHKESDATERLNTTTTYKSRCKKILNAGEGVEKREPSYTVGGNAN